MQNTHTYNTTVTTPNENNCTEYLVVHAYL